MPKSGSELLFLGLIIAGFLLFNYVAQKLAKKAREHQEAEKAARGQQESETADAWAPPPEDAPLEDIWGRTPAPPPAAPAPVARVEAEAPVAPPRPSPRRSGTRLFRTRKDLRHAVVLMTVLGPCRALEPHEQR
ncbi:MAG: hypothetical protein OEZ09_09230 [Betaproteobacteria bacterium]|nr:hypothetical protein [Betaproteobacteria bacterium]MDH4324669.1 hypothetical protein [Betaproteobacteria bacterium]MDH5578629.1 hypothetical protein [Betaproteobacteria bacterium]